MTKLLNPIRPESIAKNLAIAAHFTAGAMFLAASRFYYSDQFPGNSVATLAAVGLFWLCYGAYLVMPARAKTADAIIEPSGTLLPESLAKNVVIALFFGCGAAVLTLSKLFLSENHLVQTGVPGQPGPMFTMQYSAKDIALVATVALIWLAGGCYAILPSRRRTRGMSVAA